MADVYLLIEGKQEGLYIEGYLPAWHGGLTDGVPISNILEGYSTVSASSSSLYSIFHHRSNIGSGGWK